jgi:hypothetical protein
MNLFYLAVTPHLCHAGHKFFSRSHWIQLSSGEVLLAAEFDTAQAESIWASQPHVTPLPHPLSGQAIGTDIAARLSDLGSQATDTVFNVAEKATGLHPQMSLKII